MKLIRRIETSLNLPRSNPRHHTVDSSSEKNCLQSGEEFEANGHSNADLNNLIERLYLYLY